MQAFDEEWSAPRDWVAMYRAQGLQVVPALSPTEDKNWKRPALAWKEFEDALIPQAQIDRWYGKEGQPGGEHAGRKNMGLITGLASGGVFCVDLDTQKDGGTARQWWADLLAENCHGQEPITPAQRTGGGGRQILFRAPEGWSPPTFKTSAGIDVRGQGGFMVAPPSRHASGKDYEWERDRAPWAVAVMEAPEWLTDAIEALREAHGGAVGQRPERAPSEGATDAWGFDVDAREEKLQRMVWAAVLDLYREAPIEPPKVQQEAEIARLWGQYERSTRTRLTGLDNADGLEREGRGISELRRKWRYAMRKWSGQVRDEAARPRPFVAETVEPYSAANYAAPSEANNLRVEGEETSPPPKSADLYEVLSIADLRALPDAEWLIKDTIPQGGLGFLYGAPGSYKSFVCYDLALSLAYGVTEWIGREIKPCGGVLYIASEGASGAQKRVTAWQQKHGIADDSGDFHLIRKSINFMDGRDVDRLLRTVRQHLEQVGPVAMIFVDTVSRVLPGADENLQKDMTVFVAACDALRETFGATVMGVHHTNKAGEMRGSTVFLGQGDVIFKLERHEDEHGGVLICEKQKDAEDGWKIGFTADKVDWVPAGRIESVSSLAVAWKERATDAAPMGRKWPARDVLRAFQRDISAAFMKGAPLSSFPQAKREGRYAPGKLASAYGVPQLAVSDVIETWLNEGVLEVRAIDGNVKIKGLQVVKWLD